MGKCLRSRYHIGRTIASVDLRPVSNMVKKRLFRRLRRTTLRLFDDAFIRSPFRPRGAILAMLKRNPHENEFEIELNLFQDTLKFSTQGTFLKRADLMVFDHSHKYIIGTVRPWVRFQSQLYVTN